MVHLRSTITLTHRHRAGGERRAAAPRSAGAFPAANDVTAAQNSDFHFVTLPFWRDGGRHGGARDEKSPSAPRGDSPAFEKRLRLQVHLSASALPSYSSSSCSSSSRSWQRGGARGCVNANWQFNSQLLINDCNAFPRDTGVLRSITIIKIRPSPPRLQKISHPLQPWTCP